ncbi:hypothetical protein B4U80_14173, partial [Leptotrombidium deliense]
IMEDFRKKWTVIASTVPRDVLRDVLVDFLKSPIENSESTEPAPSNTVLAPSTSRKSNVSRSDGSNQQVESAIDDEDIIYRPASSKRNRTFQDAARNKQHRANHRDRGAVNVEHSAPTSIQRRETFSAAIGASVGAVSTNVIPAPVAPPSASTKRVNDGESLQCAVCQNSIEATQEIKLNCCPHKFHIRCLKHAFLWDTKCPCFICTANIYVHDDSDVQIISDDERTSENDTTTNDEYDFDDIGDEDYIMECTICARQINGNKASMITKCRQSRRGHYCHKTCLETWITAIEPTNSFSKTCPADNCNNLADSYVDHTNCKYSHIRVCRVASVEMDKTVTLYNFRRIRIDRRNRRRN